MTDNVIKFPGITKHDISASEMLQNIATEEPKNAFVIVWPEDGGMPTYHSSTGDIPVILMRLHDFIHKWHNGEFE